MPSLQRALRLMALSFVLGKCHVIPSSVVCTENGEKQCLTAFPLGRVRSLATSPQTKERALVVGRVVSCVFFFLVLGGWCRSLVSFAVRFVVSFFFFLWGRLVVRSFRSPFVSRRRFFFFFRRSARSVRSFARFARRSRPCRRVFFFLPPLSPPLASVGRSFLAFCQVNSLGMALFLSMVWPKAWIWAPQFMTTGYACQFSFMHTSLSVWTDGAQSKLPMITLTWWKRSFGILVPPACLRLQTWSCSIGCAGWSSLVALKAKHWERQSGQACRNWLVLGSMVLSCSLTVVAWSANVKSHQRNPKIIPSKSPKAAWQFATVGTWANAKMTNVPTVAYMFVTSRGVASNTGESTIAKVVLDGWKQEILYHTALPTLVKI